jgi:membrane associated rhomboid family serine protease
MSVEQATEPMNLFRQPLLRLLAVNLAIGASVALLMVGGLVWLNPSGLRDLILADRSPATALGLLLFGFVITFGSAAMGSAIMTLVRSDGRGGGACSPD